MNTRQRILDQARTLSEKGEQRTVDVLAVTLTKEQYQRLEQQFAARVTDNPTLAAIQLGQQMVLAAVRQGFTA